MTTDEVLADAKTLKPGESRSYELDDPSVAFFFADDLAIEGLSSRQDSPGGGNQRASACAEGRLIHQRGINLPPGTTPEAVLHSI